MKFLEKLKAYFWLVVGDDFLRNSLGEGVKTGVFASFFYVVVALPIAWILYSYFGTESVFNSGTVALGVLGMMIAGIYPALLISLITGFLSGLLMGVWLNKYGKKTARRKFVGYCTAIAGSITTLLCLLVWFLAEDLFLFLVVGGIPGILFLFSEMLLAARLYVNRQNQRF